MLNRFYNVLRGMLVVFSLSGIAVVFMFLFTPSIINKADTVIVGGYMWIHKWRLEKIKALNAEEQVDEKIKSLEKLLYDLKDIKKMDRLDMIKRTALNNLT